MAKTAPKRAGPAGRTRRAKRSEGEELRHGSTTSKEVASLAGVSQSAVSRTFTPGASVSERTRRKVLDAASELGYQPNVLARSLIQGRSRLIGLVMGEWGNPFYTTMLRGFSERLEARGYEVILMTRDALGRVDSAARRLLQYRVDGVVMVSCDPGEQVARELERAGLRVVLVNGEPRAANSVGIVTDSERVGRDVAALLLRAGYTRFAIARGAPDQRPGNLRADSFREAVMASRRARVVIDQFNIVGYEAGRRFAREAMAAEPRPDAIFCFADLTAVGVLDGARRDLGVAVPEDLGIVGFGDAPSAEWAGNALTTVRLPIDRMIDASIAALLSSEPRPKQRLIMMEADIVERATVRTSRTSRDS
jgi:DNA-binding LacI/PurR family transcriptional regulator